MRLSALIALLAFLIVVFGIWVDVRLRRVAVTFAKSAIKTTAIDCANRASLRALEELGITYDELAVIRRNEEGLATSVEINAVTANRMKSYISNEISKELAAYGEVTFKVPISAAFGVYYTSFKVPKLRYTVSVTTTVESSFKNDFIGAGINQVLHQILMTVTLESDLAMLKDNTEQTFSTDFIIAQTVIVGAVPEAFTSVGHATDEVMEDIFDFGAEPEN
jgi:sporulation protein YunB